ncbi:MAG: glycosyl hydrolase [Alteraurantiacibacter sp.]|nr:glycosyl hydrolase [Alteraurantiacibacter sp.]
MSAALALVACASVAAQTSATAPDQVAVDPLRDGFADPPQSARPRTWWHWMNGNVTREGIVKDLAWLSSVGIGGIQTFDASLSTPQVVDERVIYMTQAWRDAFRLAVAEADRHGLELTIASSPGWSHTGGPWVQPEDAMKKLVWAETWLPGGQRFTGTINQAPRVTGDFQTLLHADSHAQASGAVTRHVPQLAGRVAVLAVRQDRVLLPEPVVSLVDGTRVDGAPLADADLESGIAVPLTAERHGLVTFTYPAEVTVRTVHMVMPGLVRPFRDPPLFAYLEAQVDGAWQVVRELPLSNTPTTYSFAPVTARAFRLRLENNTNSASSGEIEGPPGAIAIDFFALGDISSVRLTDFRLTGQHRLDRVEQKAGFATSNDYHAIASAETAPVPLQPAEVIDLTDRVTADGLLDWIPPAGSDWLVLDFGWSLTGKTNHPAPPEATGLEVDKLDPAAVRRYLEHYLATYRAIAGDEMIGARGITGLLTDSIEVGLANWTPAMEQVFAERRGYALGPWLPALAGIVIGSEAETERFLYDWRRTLAEQLSDSLYRTVAEVAHANGLVVYGEALEDKRPLLGDDLAMRAFADVPMAALWTWPRGQSPRTTLLGDMKGASSGAHLYGRPFVAAESMTAANSPWAFAPRDLRRIIDLEFLHGINRPVIHTSVHQPRDDLQPGLSLAIFGQYFNRHESWAGLARPWVDYMARSAFLLQQGTWHADIAYFHGEEAPLTAQYASRVPDGRPRHYAFDYVGPDALADSLRVEDGALVSLGGTRYRALFLGDPHRLMTLPTLRRVAALAAQGATIVGLPPRASPSLADDADTFARLVAETWARPNVIASNDVEHALAGLGLAPDFVASAAGNGQPLDIGFVHRQLDDGGHIYFLANPHAQAVSFDGTFRVTGLVPEWWNAVNGQVRPLSFSSDGTATRVPLALGPEESGFVVFREQAQVPARQVIEAVWHPVGTIEGRWQVSFQPGRGAPEQIVLDRLIPLDTHPDFGVRHFSGVATYTTSFEAPQVTGELWLDLGRVADMAEVLVNGQSAGITWWAPDRVKIGHLLRPGTNRLEVRVANLWVNRLIGDAQEGAERITFTAAPTYRSDAPLRPSGLIGPVIFMARH